MDVTLGLQPNERDAHFKHRAQSTVNSTRNLADDLTTAMQAAALNRALLALADAGWSVFFRDGQLVQRGSGLWTADARVVTFEWETRRGTKRESRLGILVRSPGEMRTLGNLEPSRTHNSVDLPGEATALVATLEKVRTANARPVLYFANGTLLDLRSARVSAIAHVDGPVRWVEVSVDGAKAEKPHLYSALL